MFRGDGGERLEKISIFLTAPQPPSFWLFLLLLCSDEKQSIIILLSKYSLREKKKIITTRFSLLASFYGAVGIPTVRKNTNLNEQCSFARNYEVAKQLPKMHTSRLTFNFVLRHSMFVFIVVCKTKNVLELLRLTLLVIKTL